MKLILILRPVSKRLLTQIRSIVQKLTEMNLTNENDKIITFFDSSDMGKKYIILYYIDRKKAYKLFWKVIPNVDLDQYVSYWSDEEINKIYSNTFTRNEIISSYADFKNASNSICDQKSFFNNLLNVIKNAELDKKEKDILKIPELKIIKKKLKKYDKIIRDIYDLLNSLNGSLDKKILSTMEQITKSKTISSYATKDIEKLITYIMENNESFPYFKQLIDMLNELKNTTTKLYKSCHAFNAAISKFEKSKLSKEELRIVSEIGKFEAIEDGFLEYDDSLLKIVNLDELDDSELKFFLEKIRKSIYESLFENEVYIIHKNIGWQQLCTNYSYRGFNIVPRLNTEKKDYDISAKYDILKKYLDVTESDAFPLLLFAYMLFATNKSLFKSSSKKFFLNIRNNYNRDANESIIEYVSRLNMNFMSLEIDLKEDFPNDLKKEFKIPSSFVNPLYLNYAQYKLHDFPVFLYEVNPKRKKLSNKRSKTKRVITHSVLQNELKSKISYIFLNVRNEENVFLNIHFASEIENDILKYNLPVSSEENYGFRTLIKDYQLHISKILSEEISKRDNEYKSKIFEKISNEFYNDYTISDGIAEFTKCLLKSCKQSDITIEFFLYLEKFFRKLTFIQLEDIGIGFNNCKNSDEQNLFISRFIRVYNFYSQYNANNSKDLLLKNHDGIEEFKGIIADIAIDRYYELLISKYIYTPNYTPKYFDNLLSDAKKYLKDNLKGQKYDPTQVLRCSFLLASMMSFKSYIDECLPDNSNDFELYFQKFVKIIIQMCCTLPTVYIDSNNSLPEFSEFLKLQIDNNSIIDAESGTDSKIGWIDRKKNKIYMKNDSGNNFYDKFTKYLIDRNKHIELSKQAFVRDVLEEKGILSARFAGGGKRYDYERKIGDKKYRVLVLDCELLKI